MIDKDSGFKDADQDNAASMAAAQVHIEELRGELYMALDRYGTQSPIVLLKSEQLDAQLNQYCTLLKQTCIKLPDD